MQVIEPRKRRVSVDIKELWRHRELLYFMTWRDVKVRYKQTVLGALWAILQPLLAMAVFTAFFGRFVGLESRVHGFPYTVFVYAGLLPWMLFANSLVASGTSMINSANLVTKIYFPRIAVPLAVLGVGLVDFFLSAVVLLVMMLIYGVGAMDGVLIAPLFIAAALLAAAGAGCLLSALTVSYRDFRYVVPFLVQIWTFATPVIYPLSVVPDRWRWAVALNPMTGPVEGFRAAVLGQPTDWPVVGVSMMTAVFVAVAGVAYFSNVERDFADII